MLATLWTAPVPLPSIRSQRTTTPLESSNALTGRSPAAIVLRARVLEAADDGSVVVRRLWDRELEFGRQS